MSSAPGKCCTEGYKWTGESSGKEVDVAGYNAYISGDESSKKLLYLCTDIYGIQYNNARLIADNFAQAGYLVVAIDFFNNNPYSAGDDLGTWIKDYMPEGAYKIADKTLEALKGQYQPDFVAAVGYCYGAAVVGHLQSTSAIDAGAWAHPSFITEELVESLKVPLHLSLAETDHIFGDELRTKTFEILRANKLRYYANLYSGTTHGFAARGDKSDPVVEEAMKKAFGEQLYFFDLIKSGLGSQ